ncbi:MAG: hypothetical protein ACYTEW_24395 [Planctomycetota bacterium]
MKLQFIYGWGNITRRKLFGKNLILADEKEKLVTTGHSLKALLPGGEKLTDNQAISLGNYALLNHANPFRGEVYGFKDFNGNLNLVDGYKLLVRWAKKISEYDEKYEQLPVGVERVEEGDAGYRITILRHDKKSTLSEYVKLGATFQEAYDIVSNQAVGIVLKSEMWSKKKNKPIDPPTGWSWDQVARKRALKNVLNLAYAMPSLDELAKDSWIVEGVETVTEDWAEPGVYQSTEEAEAHAKLAAQERAYQEKLSEMDEGQRTAHEKQVNDATEAMRNNGDDDPIIEEEPKLSAGMQASTE